MKNFSLCCFRQKVQNQDVELNQVNIKVNIEEKGSRSLQFAAAFILSFSVFGLGTLHAWTSPSLTYLTSAESKIPITMNQRAWIASLSNLGTIFGYLIIQFTMDRIGRKYVMIKYAILQIISWLMITFGQSFEIICAARILGGFAYSPGVVLFSVYVAETVEKDIRGTIVMCLITCSDLGILAVGLMGAWLSYENMNLVLILPSVLHLMTLPFLPESPYFLFMKNRDEEAVRTLMRLRGTKKPESISNEVEEIKEFTTQFKEYRRNNFVELFTSRSNRKAMMIMTCAIMTYSLCGSVVILTYTQEIFGYSGFSLSPAYSSSLVVGVKILSSLVVIQLVDRGNRRVLFLFSGISSGIAVGVVGLFFFLKFQLKMNVSSFTWLPLAGLITFEVAASLGLTCLPLIILGEIFPMRVKRTAVNCVYMLNPLLFFSAKFLFPILIDSAGIYTGFWIFSIICVVGSITFFYIAPETKGKSLNEIQTILKSK